MKEDKTSDMKKLETFLGDIQGGIVLCNYCPETMTAEILYINRGWSDITGYTKEQLTEEKGGNPQALIFSEDKHDTDEKYAQQLRQGGTYELLYRIVHRSGKLCWVVDKGVSTTLPDGRLQNKSVITEVTEIKEREEHMALLAQTDQLTGLNNKATFTRMAQAGLDWQEKCQCALLILDIDSFKHINDTYGHDFGDKVLTAVAEQMKSFFRGGDILGRVGGDEFMVLMTAVSNEEAVMKKTRELCAAVSRIKIPEHAHTPITVSVGVSLFMQSKHYEAMFSEADTALYSAKSQGKNQCCIWRRQEKVD